MLNTAVTFRVKASMRKHLLKWLLPILCCSLVACSTADYHYHPLRARPTGNWEGHSTLWGGYTETKTSPQSYQIGFESYNQPSPEATAYFSLVRAAERAAIDAQETFFLESARVKTLKQRSNFAAYTIPGSCETYTETRQIHDPCGNVTYVTQQVTTHEPDTYVPARNAINSIYKVSRHLSYTDKHSKRFDTYRVLSNAYHNTHGYGKPKLDPRAKAQMKAWTKQRLGK